MKFHVDGKDVKEFKMPEKGKAVLAIQSAEPMANENLRLDGVVVAHEQASSIGARASIFIPSGGSAAGKIVDVGLAAGILEGSRNALVEQLRTNGLDIESDDFIGTQIGVTFEKYTDKNKEEKIGIGFKFSRADSPAFLDLPHAQSTVGLVPATDYPTPPEETPF